MELTLLPALVGCHGAAVVGCLGTRSSGFGKLCFLASPAMRGCRDEVQGNTSTSGRLSSQEGWIPAAIAKRSAVREEKQCLLLAK